MRMAAPRGGTMTGPKVHDDFEVPPLSVAAIAQRAHGFLGLLKADNLDRVCPLDIHRLIDDVARVGIDVYATEDAELPLSDAETQHGADGRTHILVRKSVFEGSLGADGFSHRPRATICHELGHAVLHGRLLARSAMTGVPLPPLVRTKAGELERSAEEQAWAFAGVLLMPIPALKTVRDQAREHLSGLFRVSPDLAGRHVARVRSLLV